MKWSVPGGYPYDRVGSPLPKRPPDLPDVETGAVPDLTTDTVSRLSHGVPATNEGVDKCVIWVINVDRYAYIKILLKKVLAHLS